MRCKTFRPPGLLLQLARDRGAKAVAWVRLPQGALGTFNVDVAGLQAREAMMGVVEMSSRSSLSSWGPASGVWPLVALILFQGLCALVFFVDVAMELGPQPWSAVFRPENLSEIAATVGLALGLVFEGFVLARLLKRQARMQESLTAAATALSDLMLTYFDIWGLTPTEQDVAAFTIKGCSIAEIAVLRGSAEGTIKTHLNAIYRKSGVSGRAQLVSVLVDDLLQTPLIAPPSAMPQRRAAVAG